MTWFDELRKRLEAEGQRPHVLEAGDGRLLVAEHGARVLGVELPGVDHNLIFHTDATPDGKVTGGDRLWIAPEVAYFWPNLDEALRDPKGTAATPAAIDPGAYQTVHSSPGVGIHLACHDIRLASQIDQSSGTVQVDRSWSPCEAPESANRASDLSCLSFSTQHLFNYRGASEQFVGGAWSILQVPPTGTLICPVTKHLESDEVRSYYDPFGDKHVVVEDRCVKFFIDGQRRIKMGIKPEHTLGRMGYYRRLNGDHSSLIVRIFAPQPGEPYCDLPRDDPRHRQLEKGEIEGPVLGGDCLQAYNDDGDAFPGTSFGEMEYHDPCIVVGRGPQSRAGACVTHVVAGPDDAVKAWGAEILGVEVVGIE